MNEREAISGETASLRPAEIRMLRYLMAETGYLLAQLDTLEDGKSGLCHLDRAAI